MSDDLVKRLRRADTCIFPTERDLCHCGEAADRILELEAALREIAKGPRDVDKSYVSLFHEIQFEARVALGDKTNEN
jgi:hypothetical protein